MLPEEAFRQRGRLSLALLLLMVFSVLLVAWRVQQSELEIARARSARQLAGVAAEVGKALSFGLSARDLEPLSAFLAARRADDEGLVAVWIFDEAGGLAVGVGRSPEGSGFERHWRLRLDGEGPRIQTIARPPVDYLGTTVVDPLGRPAAQVWLAHDRSGSYRNGERVATALAPTAAVAALVAIGLLTAMCRFGRGVFSGQLRSAAAQVFLALLVVVPIMIHARALTRPLIDAQIALSAHQFGRAAAIRIGYAMDIGIPLHALPGVDVVLRDQLLPAREFAAIALVDAEGRRLATARAEGGAESVWDDPKVTQVRTELREGAAVLVRYSGDYAETMMAAALGDLLFAVLIAGVLARELAQAARILARQGPAQTSSDLVDLRLFVFAVAMSEELLRPFLAPFAAEAPSPALLAGWSVTALAGLPVATFMMALAVAQPCGAALAGRFDLRRMMLVVTLFGAVALLAAGLASNIIALALLRFVNGASYGLSLIFAQMAILRRVAPGQRARALAGFATAIVAAGIAGPAIGAIIAERFGYRIAFAACASMCMAAAMLCCRMRLDGNGPASEPTSSLRALGGFLRQGDAMAVTLLAAVPARLVAAAVLILMTPLYLVELGESTTVVGRVLPLYFVAFFASAQAIAHYSDRSGRRKACVVLGCVLSGVGCAVVPWVGGVVGAAVGCALLGFGQAALSAPQLAWVADLCAYRGRAAVEQGVAAFRFLERAGSVAAAPMVALCVQGVGLSLGFAVFGGAVALAGLALLWLRSPPVWKSGNEENLR